MNLSFREKSLWISLVSALLLFGAYFAVAFPELFGDRPYAGGTVWLLAAVVAALIAVEVVLHAALAVWHVRRAGPQTDERERWIELRATRASYFILAGGVWASFVGLAAEVAPLLMANVLLLSFILAEVVGFVLQLVSCRRGA